MLTKIKNLLKSFNLLFWVVVIVPTTISALYFGLIASDVYISQSKFIIYNPQSQSSSTGGLGSLLAGAGISSSSYGVNAAHDYITSRDALKALQQSLDIRSMYGRTNIDWINRYGGVVYFRKTFEGLYKYYTAMVGVEVDTTSNISTLTVNAYSPDDAKRINTELLTLAQQLIVRINEKADADTVQFYRQEVADGRKRAEQAAIALSQYRNQHGVFDPAPQSSLQFQLVAKLQDQLLQQENALAQILITTPQNPEIPVLQKSIETTRGAITNQTAIVVGASSSLASKSVVYEKLILDQSFAEKELAAAITAMEQARIQAQKQQLFIETVVNPNVPDEALQPKRLRGLLATIVIGLMLWGVLSVVIGGVKEHHDR